MINLKALNSGNRVMETTHELSRQQHAFLKMEEVFQKAHMFNRSEGLLIVGESGAGKTSIIEKFAMSHPIYTSQSEKIIPVISLTLPSEPTVKGLASLLLSQFHESWEPSLRETEQRFTGRLVNYLLAAKTSVIALDEAQHLVERNSTKKMHLVADWLKNLMNTTNVGIVLCGTTVCDRLLLANSQLRRRFGKILLEPWDLTKKSEIEEMAILVSKFLKNAEVKFDPNLLISKSGLKRLWYASEGRVGYLAKLISEACSIASSNRKKVVGFKELSEAFESKIWLESEAVNNPFSKKFKFEQLNDPGQPFCPEVL